jgi:hypothetical protein
MYTGVVDREYADVEMLIEKEEDMECEYILSKSKMPR